MMNSLSSNAAFVEDTFSPVDSFWSLPSDMQKNIASQRGLEWRSMVKDSGDDAIQKLANDLNLKLDSTTKDYLTKYYLDEQSNTKAWSRQMDASNTQYQRAVADLKQAGLNPFLAIQSLSGSSPSSSGTSAQGGLFTSRKNAQTQQRTSVGQTIFTVLAIIAAAAIKALL